MGGGADAGRAVDIHADVTFVGDDRLTRVQRHANANRSVCERDLSLAGCGERSGRVLEGNEEGISLCIDLDPAVALECFAQQSPVLGQCLRETFRPEFVQQSRRAFNIGEQKRDGAGGETAHLGEVSSLRFKPQ